MFCTTCAAANPIATKACRVCGSGLIAASERPPHRAAGAARGRERVRAALALVAMAAVVVILGGAANANRTNEPRAYARAEADVAAGRYPEALTAFAVAGDHRDAAARHASLAALVAAHHLAYRDAVDAQAAGAPQRAIALLRPLLRALPRDQDAAQLLAEARTLHTITLAREADAAELRHDWLAAERALGRLAALDPADEATATRLADLRRHHAPLVVGRDRALWLAGPDGTDDRLLFADRPVAWPTWSPDRQQIAFTSDGAAGGIDLYRYDLATGTAHRLAGGLRPYAGPVWSPSGDRIAFAAAGIDGPLSGSAEAGIRVVDVATGGVVDVTGRRVRNALYPSWSPDGSRLAFVSREEETGGYSVAPAGAPSRPGQPAPEPSGEVYVADLATGRIDNLSRGRVPHPWRAAWSPAGENVLVFTREPGMSYDRDRARLALLDAATGAITDVPTGAERITMPVWSPTGDRIAYAAGEHDIVLRTIGGGRRRVTLDAAVSRFLAWSPDGSSLLAVAEGMGGPSYVVPTDRPDSPRPTTDLPPPDPKPLRLPYDVDRRQSGAPQWTAAHPPPPTDLLPTVDLAGTALDPEPSR